MPSLRPALLVPWLADWTYLKEHDAFNQTFDVSLHLGTLLAVALYFWADIVRILAAFGRSVARRRVVEGDERIAWFVLIATIPALLIGGLAEDAIAEHLGDPWQIAICLAVFGVLLFVADRTRATRRMQDLGPGTALLVGLAQSIALLPGTSRSGITITAARFLGLSRDEAARFSFYLLIPTVLAAVVYKGVKDVLLGDLPPGWGGPFLVGTIAAAGSGLLAIDLLLGYVRRYSYSPFVVYRILAAIAILILIAAGVREAGF